jgi:hypothetical protein
MQGTRRLLAVAVVSLLVVPDGEARPAALGIVVQANLASLGTHAVSEGSSVYAGEQLSTGEGGSLQLRSGAVRFQLMGESSATVRGNADVETQAFSAELAKGEAILSVASGAAGEICARGACVRGGGAGPVTVRVRVMGPKELRICAKRGGVTLTYHGEGAAIAEGGSYVAVLDPPDDQKAPQQGAKGTLRRRTAFLLIAIGVATAIAVPLIMKGSAYESPDRP